MFRSILPLALLWIVATIALYIRYRERVRKSANSGKWQFLGVAIRCGIVFAFFGFIACRGFGLRAAEVGLAIAAVLLLPLDLLIEIHSADRLPLLLIVFFPLWFLQCLIVGFPEPILPTVSRADPRDEELICNIVGSKGCVVSPLRPIGIIEIEGRRWTAFTGDKQYVPKGTMVHVVDERGVGLLVVVDDEQTDESDSKKSRR